MDADRSRDGGGLVEFTRRAVTCYRCGARGVETRDDARRGGADVFALVEPGTPPTLLVACCPSCRAGTTRDDRERFARGLDRDVRYGLVGGAVRPERLSCPVPRCPTSSWARLGPELPLAPVYDPYIDRVRHPCPWCVAEAPARAAAHQRTATRAARRDLRLWAAELVAD